MFKKKVPLNWIRHGNFLQAPCSPYHITVSITIKGLEGDFNLSIKQRKIHFIELMTVKQSTGESKTKYCGHTIRLRIRITFNVIFQKNIVLNYILRFVWIKINFSWLLNIFVVLDCNDQVFFGFLFRSRNGHYIKLIKEVRLFGHRKLDKNFG